MPARRSAVALALIWTVATFAPMLAVAQSSGTSVNPFTTIFEWNRADLSQFTKTDVGTSAYVLNEIVRTTQPSAAYIVIPVAEWSTSSGSGAPQYRYLMTSETLAPAAGELLVMEADIGYTSGDLDNNGFACFDPANPTSNYFVITYNWYWRGFRINKWISGGRYPQTDIVQSAGPDADPSQQRRRIRVVLDTTGRVQLYSSNQVLADIPMTLGNPTLITSCKVGFVIAAANAPFRFSRLRVFRMVPAGLQLFQAPAPRKEER